RKIDHQPVIAGGEAWPVVAAAADGDELAAVAAEAHRCDNVGYIRAPGNQRRPLVDHAVVELARLVITGVGRLDQLASESRGEGAQIICVEHGSSPVNCDPEHRS